MYLLLVLHIAQQSKTVSQYRTAKKPPPPVSLFTTYTFLPSLWAVVLLKSGPVMHARMLQFSWLSFWWVSLSFCLSNGLFSEP